MKPYDKSWIITLIILVITFIVLAIAGCRDDKSVANILIDKGFNHINVIGYSTFGCKKLLGHQSGIDFVAYKNMNKVNGIICCESFFNYKDCLIVY